MGFIKSRYIGRTIIQPHQHDREDKVKIKLNPIQAVVQGKSPPTIRWGRSLKSSARTP